MTEVHDFDDRILEEKQDEIFLQQAMEELMLESDDENSAVEDFLDPGVSGETILFHVLKHSSCYIILFNAFILI